MTTIIAGYFQQQDGAQRAAAALHSAGFSAGETTTFFVNPPGQHDRFPIGGDEDESPGTQDAKGGTATGAAVGGAVGVAVGLATAPVLGPAAAVAGAGVGAYVGSLYGALGKLEGETGADSQVQTRQPAVEKKEPAPRKSGMLVAVAAATPEQQASAIRILRGQGASDIERAQGTIAGGQWPDFDPVAPVNLVEG